MVQKIRFIILVSLLFMVGVIARSQTEKCGTFKYVQRLNQINKTNSELVSVSRPALQKNVLTPNGKIRIHYDSSGTNEPALVDLAGNRIPNTSQQFIDTLRSLLDSVWRTEIDIFEFTAPPSDENRGGGNEFDFYVLELGGGTFGETIIENDLPVGPVKQNQQYASYVQMDNDFGTGYRTKGVQAMMATTAHEFHHAIQVGGSGVWEDGQFYFYEICAEAMENTVFNDAKDYLFDVKTYFTNISSTPLFQQRVSFQTAGYERAIWGMFLMKKFGTVIMRELWQEMQSNRPIGALKNALALHISTIEKEYSNFSIWNFYTNYRSNGLKYFTDAEFFPLASYSDVISLNNSSETLQKTSQSFISSFIKVANQLDTVFFIISNTNLPDAEANAGHVFPFQLKVSTSPGTDVLKVSNSIFAGFTVSDPQYWNYALSTDTISLKKPLEFDVINCFPNPFLPEKSNLFFISLNEPSSFTGSVDMYVFSSSSELIYSGQPQLTNIFGKRFAVWNGRANKGELVSSGMYFYVLSKSSNVLKGKFAVIR